MEAIDRWSIQDKFVLTINLTVFCCDFLKIFYNVGRNEIYEKCVFEIGKSVYRRNFILSLVFLTVTWPFLKPILRNCYWVIFKLANTSILTLVWGKCFTYGMCWEYRNFEPTTIQFFDLVPFASEICKKMLRHDTSFSNQVMFDAEML